MITAKISVKVSWWLRCYVYGLRIFSLVTGIHLGPEKIKYWIDRGVSVKIEEIR